MNMRNLPNIDKSVFYKGQYVGHTQHGIVRIRKVSKQWCANITQKDGSVTTLRTDTLTKMSAVLTNY